MNTTEFFRSFVEASTEQIALFGIAGGGNVNDGDRNVTYKVAKNVFTDFDGKLSRYLAATTGVGLSAACVETRVQGHAHDTSKAPAPVTHVRSIPDALATAARLALGDADSATVRLGAWVNDAPGPGKEYEITKDTVQMLEHALKICGQLGTVEFLDLTGSFDRVLVRPGESDLDIITIDLVQGTVEFPATQGSQSTGWKGPIFGFERAAAGEGAVVSYLSRAQHAEAASKERAILAFREAAETQIMKFDAALAGRPLVDHRLERVMSLVARLKTGLGENLSGLSDSAQLTALEWADQMQDTTRSGPVLVS